MASVCRSSLVSTRTEGVVSWLSLLGQVRTATGGSARGRHGGVLRGRGGCAAGGDGRRPCVPRGGRGRGVHKDCAPSRRVEVGCCCCARRTIVVERRDFFLNRNVNKISMCSNIRSINLSIIGNQNRALSLSLSEILTIKIRKGKRQIEGE